MLEILTCGVVSNPSFIKILQMLKNRRNKLKCRYQSYDGKETLSGSCTGKGKELEIVQYDKEIGYMKLYRLQEN
jgi:hypothetical protein